jgi:hypothetical protein
MASDVSPKASGPLWKPEKRSRLTKQGVPDLNDGKKRKVRKVHTIYWLGRGKASQKWSRCRGDWLRTNPPDHNGYYQCALGDDMVHLSEVTLDHIITRSRAPELRYVLSNLQPACEWHNYERGSMTMEAWNARRKAKNSA